MGVERGAQFVAHLRQEIAALARQAHRLGQRRRARRLGRALLADVARHPDHAQQRAVVVEHRGAVGLHPDHALRAVESLLHGGALAGRHHGRVVGQEALGKFGRPQLLVGLARHLVDAVPAGGRVGLVDRQVAPLGILEPDPQRQGVDQRAQIACLLAQLGGARLHAQLQGVERALEFEAHDVEGRAQFADFVGRRDRDEFKLAQRRCAGAGRLVGQRALGAELLDRLGQGDDRIDEAPHPVDADGEAERQDQAGGKQDRAHGLVDVAQSARARGAQAQDHAGLLLISPRQQDGIIRALPGHDGLLQHGGDVGGAVGRGREPARRAHQPVRHDGGLGQVLAVAAVGREQFRHHPGLGGDGGERATVDQPAKDHDGGGLAPAGTARLGLLARRVGNRHAGHQPVLARAVVAQEFFEHALHRHENVDRRQIGRREGDRHGGPRHVGHGRLRAWRQRPGLPGRPALEVERAASVGRGRDPGRSAVSALDHHAGLGAGHCVAELAAGVDGDPRKAAGAQGQVQAVERHRLGVRQAAGERGPILGGAGLPGQVRGFEQDEFGQLVQHHGVANGGQRRTLEADGHRSQVVIPGAQRTVERHKGQFLILPVGEIGGEQGVERGR